jgi:predicted RNA-binding Zn ribbon-like protein
MAKDQTAPAALEQVRAFINTRDVEQGTDVFDEPHALVTWLSEQGLLEGPAEASGTELEHAVALREALRGIALAHNSGLEAPAEAVATLDDAVCRARLFLRFRRGGSGALEPEAPGVDGALGRLLAIVHGAIADGTWRRLKACRLHTCEWAFYDHTKNRSGTWCNMDVCGNRAKARAYRERHAAG